MTKRTLTSTVLVAVFLGVSHVATGDTMTVTKPTDTDDGVCAPTDCSLREAISVANAIAGTDIVVIPAGTFYLARGDIDISDHVAITGTGPTTTFIDGAMLHRVFAINAGVTVEIGDITIANAGGEIGGAIWNGGVLVFDNGIIREGRAESGGGLINNDGGTVFITRSIVADNESEYAGGIGNSGYLSIIDSTVSGNYSDTGGGGGIANSGTLIVTGSTISDNSTYDSIAGGGIYNGTSGTITFSNSTISSNGGGGAIYNNGGTILMSNVTVTGNAGAGVSNHNSGAVVLKNTIIANNGDIYDCAGQPVTSLGYNLDSNGSCMLVGPGDFSALDPLLGPLQDNGGPTLTHALLTGSAAIDAIPAVACIDIVHGDPVDRDQRGVTRPQGLACDLGAVESDDTDDDGLLDLVDNCTLVPNLDQRDTNGDGIGNICDADLNNDCNVNFADLALFESVFFSSDPDADLDGDGSVNFADLSLVKQRFFGQPGPSATGCN